MPMLVSSTYLIPYVDHHQGPRRVLALDLSALPGSADSPVAQVAVDGRWYVVVAGTVEFEVPADRAVQLSLRPVDGTREHSTSLMVRPEHKATVRYAPAAGALPGALTLIG